MASFCMLASKQIRDFWKKMWDETKMERFGINQQKHLSATVRHSRIRCCNSVQRAVHKCKPTNLNELKQCFWNNVPVPPQWCEVLQKTILQIVEKVALQSTWSQSILCVLYTSFKAKTSLFTSLYLHMKQFTALLLDWIYSELIIWN